MFERYGTGLGKCLKYMLEKPVLTVASNFLILLYLLKEEVFRAETDPGALTELCGTVINGFQPLAVN